MKHLRLILALIVLFLPWSARADGLKLQHSLVQNLREITPEDVTVDRGNTSNWPFWR